MTLECGHVEQEHTGRYRVSRDLAAILYGSFLGRGVWCEICHARCHPTNYTVTGLLKHPKSTATEVNNA